LGTEIPEQCPGT